MIKAIITDIEGTTSSLAFVKDILFPYARNHIADFIRTHAKDPLVQKSLLETRNIIGSDLTTEQLIQTLIQWIDEDKKITPLKTIQGLLWENGYLKGDFKGHIYEDAVVNIKKWKELGVRIYVYSSGSIYAQKLLFGHTKYGDLNPVFTDYFDTQIGAKTSVDSYQKIAASIAIEPEYCLFLSDIKPELDAAHEAGMHTIWLVRNGTPDQSAMHLQVSNFNGIDIRNLPQVKDLNTKATHV